MQCTADTQECDLISFTLSSTLCLTSSLRHQARALVWLQAILNNPAKRKTEISISMTFALRSYAPLGHVSCAEHLQVIISPSKGRCSTFPRGKASRYTRSVRGVASRASGTQRLTRRDVQGPFYPSSPRSNARPPARIG